MISNEILLLKIVEVNGSLSLLRERGLSHSQIAMMIKSQQEYGNIIISENSICLSSQGVEVLNENISKVAPKSKDQWIVPQEHRYTKPIPFERIILPKSKNI